MGKHPVLPPPDPHSRFAGGGGLFGQNLAGKYIIQGLLSPRGVGRGGGKENRGSKWTRCDKPFGTTVLRVPRLPRNLFGAR